jgi:hypothetical protein
MTDTKVRSYVTPRPLISQYILSLLLIIVKNKDYFKRILKFIVLIQDKI